MSASSELEIDNFKRGMLADRLDKLSPAQRALFERLYPRGVVSTRLVTAIDLCDRTIKKNIADPARLEAKP